MKTCYVTGKMRGVKCLNFPLFNKATAMLREAGWTVISPVEMDREANEPWTSPTDPDYADETFAISDSDCRRLIRRDVDAILSLRPKNGDVIILLPGWDDASTGAFGEGAVGRWAMVPMELLVFRDHLPHGFGLVTLLEDQWGAKARMRATDEHGDD